VPSSIVSDRDPIFTSKFWSELFRIGEGKLNLTIAFHPQFDRQSEAVNKVITMYLRCLLGDRPCQWLQWLPWAEYCYNISFHSSLRSTPFKVVYGREPPSLRAYTRARPAYWPFTSSSWSTTSSSARCGSGSSRCRTTISCSTIVVTGNLNAIPGIRSGCASTAMLPPSTSLAGANWVLSSMALFKYANASAMSPTSCYYHMAPSCAAPFMSACSRSSTLPHHSVLEH
jgi:hypothetical protein